MTLQEKKDEGVKVRKERVSHKAEIDTIHNFKFEELIVSQRI